MMNTFTAFFNMEGNAEEKLKRINNNMDNLRQTSLRASTSVKSVAADLAAVSIGGLKPGDQPTGAQAQFVSRRLQELAAQSKLTSSNLQQLAIRLVEAGQSASPWLTSRLRQASDALLVTASSLKVAEEQARKTNMNFTFMGDVSAGAAMNMRRVSAAAQGAMLSMSLLQKNVTGLAFSLIFLQFSGALKLSLAFAALTTIGGLVFLKLKKVFELKKEAKDLAAALFIVTRSSQAFGLIESRVEQIVSKLNLSEGKQVELTRALTTGMSNLRTRGVEPARETLEVLLSSFLEGVTTGKSFDEALTDATNTAEEFGRKLDEAGGDVRGITADVGGVAVGIEEFRERSKVALALFSHDISLTTKALKGLVDAGVAVADVLATFLPDLDPTKIFLDLVSDAVNLFKDFVPEVDKAGRALERAFGIVTARNMAEVNKQLERARDNLRRSIEEATRRLPTTRPPGEAGPVDPGFPLETLEEERRRLEELFPGIAEARRREREREEELIQEELDRRRGIVETPRSDIPLGDQEEIDARRFEDERREERAEHVRREQEDIDRQMLGLEFASAGARMGTLVINNNITGNKISSDEDARELANLITRETLKHVRGASGATGLMFQ